MTRKVTPLLPSGARSHFLQEGPTVAVRPRMKKGPGLVITKSHTLPGGPEVAVRPREKRNPDRVISRSTSRKRVLPDGVSEENSRIKAGEKEKAEASGRDHPNAMNANAAVKEHVHSAPSTSKDLVVGTKPGKVRGTRDTSPALPAKKEEAKGRTVRSASRL